MDGEGQRPLVRFLGDVANWPETGVRPRHVETHISHLFLGRKLALKMKKAVRLPYLDFSTLRAREHFCRREIEVNTRFSPQLYLGLSRIVRRADGRLALDAAEGEGEVVEWLVRMRRFDDDAVLDKVLERGALDEELQQALARAVCAAHRKAPPCRNVDMARRLQLVHAQVRQALLERRQALKGEAPESLLTELATRLEEGKALLRERARMGFARRCHGDMHLGNIALWHGTPMLFDAIEFDEELARIDILYDLAFLLMDLVHRGHKEKANALMNRWLALCDDTRNHAAVALLAPMMALRALIRAMVALDLADQNARRAARKQEEARAHARSARAMLAPARARLVVVAGLSGSGKTTLARKLAATLAPAAGAVHLRSDLERKVMAGVAESTRLPADAYTPKAARRVYDRLMERAQAALRGGWPVVLDAVFGKREERARVEELARRLGVPFTPLWLHAPLEELLARVRARRGDASDATEEVVRMQAGALRVEEPEWTRVSALGTPREVLARALRAAGVDKEP